MHTVYVSCCRRRATHSRSVLLLFAAVVALFAPVVSGDPIKVEAGFRKCVNVEFADVVGVKGSVCVISSTEGKSIQLDLAGGVLCALSGKVLVFGGEVQGEAVAFVTVTFNDPAIKSADEAKRLLDDPGERGQLVRQKVFTALKDHLLGWSDAELKGAGLTRKAVKEATEVRLTPVADVAAKKPDVKAQLIKVSKPVK